MTPPPPGSPLEKVMTRIRETREKRVQERRADPELAARQDAEERVQLERSATLWRGIMEQANPLSRLTERLTAPWRSLLGAVRHARRKFHDWRQALRKRAQERLATLTPAAEAAAAHTTPRPPTEALDASARLLLTTRPIQRHAPPPLRASGAFFRRVEEGVSKAA